MGINVKAWFDRFGSGGDFDQSTDTGDVPDTPVDAAGLRDLESRMGAYTDAREVAEITARNSAISTHAADTTAVHGIADTSALATASSVGTAVSAHTGDATDAHAASAISVSPAVGGDSDVQAVLTTHESRLDLAQSGSGSATVVDLGGNLGASKTIPTGGANIVARNAILNQAFCTVTITGLPAGEYRFVKIVGVKGASGDETLLVDDGSGAVEVATPTGAGAPFEVIVDWDGTDSQAYLAGGGEGGGASPPFAVSDTTGLQAALDGKQPLDSDLTAIAALSTASYGRALLALADAAAGRTAFGLGTAATQATGAFDAAGAAAAAQAASQPLDSDLTAIAALTTTSYGRALLALADAAAGRTAFGLGTAAVTALDVDGTLAADSDVKVPSQKAVKTYVDANAGGGGGGSTPGIFGTSAVALGDRFGQTGTALGLSNGTDVKHLSRLVYVAAASALTMRFVYMNLRGTATYTIRCAAELGSVALGNSVLVPGSFNGSKSGTVEAGCLRWTDPIALPVVKGGQFGVRTYLTIPSAAWEFNHTQVVNKDPWEAPMGGDGGVNGASASDLTAPGSADISKTSGPFYGPQWVVFETGGRIVAIAALGDSITNGGASSTAESSYIKRATSGLISCLMGAQGSATFADFYAQAAPGASPGSVHQHARIAATAGTYRYSGFGSNDVYVDSATLATLQTRALAVWTRLASDAAKVLQGTITPKTNVGNTAASAGNTVRTNFNVWLRAGAPIDPVTLAAVAVGTGGALVAADDGHPLYQVIDKAAAVETGAGLWSNASYMTDGLHLSDTGHQAIADAIQPDLLALP